MSFLVVLILVVHLIRLMDGWMGIAAGTAEAFVDADAVVFVH